MVVHQQQQQQIEEAETRAIIQAIREFQANPQLLEKAGHDIPAVVDSLGLSGTVRHAVSATLALSLAGVLLSPGITFWS
jgi:hypothetical protein